MERDFFEKFLAKQGKCNSKFALEMQTDVCFERNNSYNQCTDRSLDFKKQYAFNKYLVHTETGYGF